MSWTQFSLIASAEQLKSLVLQREGAVSFIQLFSTSTSVCQGGGKRRLNTLCNSTRPDAVLLRFNVPFYCLCCWKRLPGWGREWTKSRQSQGQGEMKRARVIETTTLWSGPCHTTEVSNFKGLLHRGEGNNSIIYIVFSISACGSGWEHEIISVLSTCHHSYCGYLLKKEVSWMKSQHVFSFFGDELCVIWNAKCKHAGAAR